MRGKKFGRYYQKRKSNPISDNVFGSSLSLSLSLSRLPKVLSFTSARVNFCSISAHEQRILLLQKNEIEQLLIYSDHIWWSLNCREVFALLFVSKNKSMILFKVKTYDKPSMRFNLRSNIKSIISLLQTFFPILGLHLKGSQFLPNIFEASNIFQGGWIIGKSWLEPNTNTTCVGMKVTIASAHSALVKSRLCYKVTNWNNNNNNNNNNINSKTSKVMALFRLGKFIIFFSRTFYLSRLEKRLSSNENFWKEK